MAEITRVVGRHRAVDWGDLVKVSAVGYQAGLTPASGVWVHIGDHAVYLSKAELDKIVGVLYADLRLDCQVSKHDVAVAKQMLGMDYGQLRDESRVRRLGVLQRREREAAAVAVRESEQGCAG